MTTPPPTPSERLTMAMTSKTRTVSTTTTTALKPQWAAPLSAALPKKEIDSVVVLINMPNSLEVGKFQGSGAGGTLMISRLNAPGGNEQHQLKSRAPTAHVNEPLARDRHIPDLPGVPHSVQKMALIINDHKWPVYITGRKCIRQALRSISDYKWFLVQVVWSSDPF